MVIFAAFMLVGLQNITFEFGSRAILKDASWHIMPNERIGLIGLNGTGKSTLLRIINDEYTVSSGTVEKARNLNIGFFNQDLLSFSTEDSILEVGMTAFKEVLQLEKELHKLTHQMATDHSEALMEAYSQKLEAFEALDGYNIQHRSAAVLEGLGFTTADLERPYNQFSGGWRMRVLLARMILQQPDLLMLDEPTNHLDLPSIEWLERYLQHYNGTVIIVSHDRYFLDRMTTKIVELYQQRLDVYSGNYSFYEKEKEQRRELQQRAYENQQDYIRQQERFIERFRAKATKATQAQSAMKRLEKLDRIEEAAPEQSKININFDMAKMPGKIVSTLKDVSKNYDELKILDHADAIIERGDKIALIGANGKGKSTLLRIIGKTTDFEGESIPGHNVEESFYAQHQIESLQLNNAMLEELKSCGSGRTEQELRSLLGCFLFSGDDVFKKISILSGGEKARVALAKTIISRANFLLLDEPTNHLDINSVQMLVESLNQYKGTYILVSHDRYFIQQSANKIWEIQDNKIREFVGTFTEWEAWKEEQLLKKNQTNRNIDNTRNMVEPTKAAAPAKENTAGKNAIDKEVKKELEKHQRRFEQVESEIEKLKKKKKELEAALADQSIYADQNKFRQVEKDYQELAQKNNLLEKEYEQLFEKIMQLEDNLVK